MERLQNDEPNQDFNLRKEEARRIAVAISRLLRNCSQRMVRNEPIALECEQAL